jgi:hypothetical protein
MELRDSSHIHKGLQLLPILIQFSIIQTFMPCDIELNPT